MAETYRAMFGFVPDMVETRIEASAELDPDFLEALEALRSHAFANPALDDRTKQLIAVAILMSHRRPAAANHMVGAVRTGATWEQIHAVAELVATFGALGTANQIGDLIATAKLRHRGPDEGH